MGPRTALAPDRVRRHRDAARQCQTSSWGRPTASEFKALSGCPGAGGSGNDAGGAACHARGGSSEPLTWVPIVASPVVHCRARLVRGALPRCLWLCLRCTAARGGWVAARAGPGAGVSRRGWVAGGLRRRWVAARVGRKWVAAQGPAWDPPEVFGPLRDGQGEAQELPRGAPREPQEQSYIGHARERSRAPGGGGQEGPKKTLQCVIFSGLESDARTGPLRAPVGRSWGPLGTFGPF